MVLSLISNFTCFLLILASNFNVFSSWFLNPFLLSDLLISWVFLLERDSKAVVEFFSDSYTHTHIFFPNICIQLRFYLFVTWRLVAKFNHIVEVVMNNMTGFFLCWLGRLCVWKLLECFFSGGIDLGCGI